MHLRVERLRGHGSLPAVIPGVSSSALTYELLCTNFEKKRGPLSEEKSFKVQVSAGASAGPAVGDTEGECCPGTRRTASRQLRACAARGRILEALRPLRQDGVLRVVEPAQDR